VKKINILILLILSTLSLESIAADCEQVIESNDALQFNSKAMTVSAACETVTVTLKHTGQLPAKIMGHNWVLTKSSDFMAVAQAGGAAGPQNNYVPQEDSRVIAYSKIIGGGESTTVTFSTTDLSSSESYTFFCSFPGHYAIMQGSLTVID
jgi:azurin|tara:strand:+ start:522 stop:974 length:453 start_codon:yes stop_codon:yes gene_type:complete